MASKLANEAGVQGPVEVEQVLEQFKAGVKKQVERGDTATHHDLGIAYMEMGLHGEAIEEFKLCLDKPEKECTAHTMIGLSYVAKGDMQAGIDHFKRALASPSRTADEELGLWFEIGNALELLGKASDALVWYEKVEEKNPEFRDVAMRIERLGHAKSAGAGSRRVRCDVRPDDHQGVGAPAGISARRGGGRTIGKREVCSIGSEVEPRTARSDRLDDCRLLGL